MVSERALSLIVFAVLSFTLFMLSPANAPGAGFPEPGKGCIGAKCHEGIEPIRQHTSVMAIGIYQRGAMLGDPNGCVVCHGGDPVETQEKDKAHSGAPKGGTLDTFVKFPASMWVFEKTCGQCHPQHVYTMHRSVMQTEAGKIQGAMWGWGAPTGYDHPYGNYDIEDTDGPVPVYGTKAYAAYMKKLMEKFPNIFPTSLKKLPEVDLRKIAEEPEQAIITYLRGDCQRCHVGVRGRNRRGDMRGLGCAACHIPYGNEGYYEGGDKATPKDKPGHLLVHSIQATREAKVTVNGKTYSGIPHETCATCHNRGKRIGVSYQGLMEFPYGSPFNAEGGKQPKLHTKKYLGVQDDHHHSVDNRKGNPSGGMFCQDCHTTNAVHGNGNISTTTLANVEIECPDCHGTPELFPWELPLGFGDEFGMNPDMDAPRGVAGETLQVQQSFGTVYPPRDGYLVSARGNPLGNVVRDKEKVIMHSAGGFDLEVPVLKEINKAGTWITPDKAITAMVQVGKHLETMECYSCHSAWAPQCYGCHVKVDYSDGKTSTDWVKSGNKHFADGSTAESGWDDKALKQPGNISESRSYLRWEDPVLGINGEGRVTPIAPGCQQITTVIGPDGKTLVNNKIWRTPPGLEGGGEEGQRGLDMSPMVPHTVVREARTCMSCHGSSKALGYGIHDGRYLKNSDEDMYIDLTDSQGELLSGKAVTQAQAIPDLPMDLSQVVTRDGKQLQTVGSHWPASRPLDMRQRENMERVGVCIACHKAFPKKPSTGREEKAITDKEHGDFLLDINRIHRKDWKVHDRWDGKHERER
jgi:hypothetical protein